MLTENATASLLCPSRSAGLGSTNSDPSGTGPSSMSVASLLGASSQRWAGRCRDDGRKYILNVVVESLSERSLQPLMLRAHLSGTLPTSPHHTDNTVVAAMTRSTLVLVTGG